MPTDEEIVSTAVDAAESIIFARYSRSEIVDMDIMVDFQNSTLTVDVYLNVPTSEDTQQVAEDAVNAAHIAVDTLLDSTG